MSRDFSTAACEVKAKKVHRCEGCGERIEPGKNYLRWAGKWSGYFAVMRMHLECANLTKDWDRDEWECHQVGDLERPKPNADEQVQ